jgi:hypothetical protein
MLPPIFAGEIMFFVERSALAIDPVTDRCRGHSGRKIIRTRGLPFTLRLDALHN